MKVRVCGKKVFTAATCCEHPEYNLCGVFTEGDENVIPCMPGIGGKVIKDIKSNFIAYLHYKSNLIIVFD